MWCRISGASLNATLISVVLWVFFAEEPKCLQVISLALTSGTVWGRPQVLSLLFHTPQAFPALDRHWTCHIAIQPDPTGAANLSEPQFGKSAAITTAELLLINVWNEGDLKRRPMLIKCNCLIAKCWELILRGFQWNYLISSQEVHCRKEAGGGSGR